MIIQPGIAKANLGLSREDVTMEDHVSQVSSPLVASFTTTAKINKIIASCLCYWKPHIKFFKSVIDHSA